MSAPVTAAVAGGNSYVFAMSCPDRLGVVAAVSHVFARFGAFITEVSNYSDPVSKRFFMRFVFDDRELTIPVAEFRMALEALVADWRLEFRLRPVLDHTRTLIAVSKYDHCLNALLHKWRAGVLPIDVVGVVSNHESCRSLVEWFGLRYFHLPLPDAAARPLQEAQILELMSSERVELLVLARYMQILSPDLCAKLSGQIINIHHSFLPSFKGSRPYHQAYERGVKVIGATAHYVTSELDDGPIIVQEVKPITHQVSVDQMVHMGHDIEATALSEAVRLHATERVLMNGQRTVVL